MIERVHNTRCQANNDNCIIYARRDVHIAKEGRAAQSPVPGNCLSWQLVSPLLHQLLNKNINSVQKNPYCCISLASHLIHTQLAINF